MKFAHVLILAVVVALAFSTVASAHVRHGMKLAGAAAVAVVTGDEDTLSDEASPSPSPSDVSPSPGPSDSASPAPEPPDILTPTPEPDETVPADTPKNHGEVVSAVARDKTADGHQDPAQRQDRHEPRTGRLVGGEVR